ncbi:MAG TPA: CAP domain-containing protein [Dehalococcoidia bacterium]|nr:CAP domain-containing protein [Dehalococcoidia bacterium]
MPPLLSGLCGRQPARSPSPAGAPARLQRTPRWPLFLVLAAAALLWVQHGGQAADAGTVQYAAGWNLVSVTSGTPLDAARGPAYVLSASGGYEAVSTGDLVAGRAAWVYFPQDATVNLGRSAADYSRTTLTTHGEELVGNPSPTLSVPVSGADVALIYDPRAGYLPASELRPGQGAVVYSAAGGTVTLGKAPPGTTTDELDQVRAALIAAPTDRPTLDRLAQDGDALLRARSYDQVQTAVDDMRAAQEQGLDMQGSGPLPPLTTLQQNSAATVREALAKARSSLADGNTAAADAAADQARRAAQAAVDDAVGLVRSSAEAAPGGSRSYAQAGRTLNPLAAAGTLLRGASFAFALGMPQGDDFWTMVQQLQSGQLTLPDTTLQPGPDGLPPVVPPPPPPATSACPIDPAMLALDSEELSMLARINALRAQQGLPALQVSITLQRIAASKVMDMAASHVYQHDPGFPQSVPRFVNCGYPDDGSWIGENLNGGHADAATVFADWESDSAHLDDMLNPNFSYVGIKRLKLDPTNPLGWLWAADFGSEPDSS